MSVPTTCVGYTNNETGRSRDTQAVVAKCEAGAKTLAFPESLRLFFQFPTDSPDTFPSPSNSFVVEIRFGLRLAYPAGDGSPAILHSILAENRLVRWLS